MSGYTSRLEELRDNNCDCPCRRDVETWAADQIESLAAENTRLRMEWVSVEDRLPEKGDWVVWFSWYESSVFQYVFANTNGEPMPWAKYWMKLPSPPAPEDK